jgi:hypothetical protein
MAARLICCVQLEKGSSDLRSSMSNLYHIRVKGELAPSWASWFDGLAIANEPNGDTLLCGALADQAALHGVLIKIRDLGLTLLAVNMINATKVNHDSTRSIP